MEAVPHGSLIKNQDKETLTKTGHRKERSHALTKQVIKGFGFIIMLWGVWLWAGTPDPITTRDATKDASWNRVLGHFARASGGFTSTVILTNATDIAGDVTLTGYLASGEAQGSMTLSLSPGSARYRTPAELFGRDDISHCLARADDCVGVHVSYQSVQDPAVAAQVEARRAASDRWLVFQGNWDWVWDGLAILNLGTEPADITVSQYYRSGDFITDEELDGVMPFEKKLWVLGDDFPTLDEAYLIVESNQPIVVVALRGTYADATPQILWENTPQPLSQETTTTDLAYDFPAQAPWYPCPDQPLDANATHVTAFNQAHHYYGAENHREITSEVTFPEGHWAQVGLSIRLECPQEGCDHWDRTGSLALVLNPEDDPSQWQTLEIARFITPYRMGMCQFIDVTPLADLLQGPQTLVSWIDTWVGPGHDSGAGWLLTAEFTFFPGSTAQPPDVINVWGRRSITLGYLDEENSVDAQIDPATVFIPADAGTVTAHLTATGHGFGHSLNCAEFCSLRQDTHINGNTCSVDAWRDDCEFNPVSPQSGTWRYDRNGWCPGAVVTGHTFDITPFVNKGENNTLDFDVRLPDGQPYENTGTTDGEPYQWISLKLTIQR